MQEIRKLLQYWEELLSKVVLLFAKKSVHVYAAHFTGPVETCFAATDVNPLYGMTQSNYESLFTQLIFLNMHLILSVSSRLICFNFFEDMIYIIFCLFFVDRVL